MSFTFPDPRTLARMRVGQTLNNKWTIDSLIDVGGMAAVYAATHRDGKRVAIKMLHPAVAAQPHVRQRFLREGYLANQINHPGAVSVLDDDVTPDGAAFLVMELLEGESVENWMTRVGGKLALRDVLALADQVLDVLSEYHAHGVIHRDIKPANLFVTKSGHVKVVDFGLARLRDGYGDGYRGGVPTAAGIVLGTASYMPPEQARGRSDEVDARSDVFAVGAVMFRALSGRLIHDARSATARLLQAVKEPAPSLATIVPSLPTGVVEVVDKALAFEKENRWATAAAMRTAVRETFAQLKDESLLVTLSPPSSLGPGVDGSGELSEIVGTMVVPNVLAEVSFGDFESTERVPLPTKG